CALMSGSPCINAGSNPAPSLSTDQRGMSRNVGIPDIGAFEVQGPPRVASTVINDGSIQRSRVTGITVNFDDPVILPATPESAFQLQRQSDSATVGVHVVSNGMAVTLTFVGG